MGPAELSEGEFTGVNADAYAEVAANLAPDATLRPFSNHRAAVPTVRQADEPDPRRTKWS
jgi:hypothetical protein